MNLWHRLRFRWRSLFASSRMDEEMAAEMREHLERRVEVNVAAGMSPEEARYAAQRLFGGIDQIKEAAREERGGRWLEELLRDVGFAFRQARKSPGFTTTAVVTLALGMAANTTFFSVLYGVVLRGLPFLDASDLVEVRNLGPGLGNNEGRIAAAELRDYRERQHSFTAIAAYEIGRVTLGLDEGAERVVQIRVTADLFPLLGIAPAQGRGFTASEEQPGGDTAIVVSHEFWQTQLAGTRNVLGRKLRLNGAEHTIIGVMPPRFVFAEPGAAIWKPLALAQRTDDRNNRSLFAVARIKPGESLARARADLQRVAQQLQLDLPAAYPVAARWGLGLTPLREGQFGHMLAPLGTLTAAAATVLLIACVNVAIMFLLRAAVRRREIMIRIALGATRWHIIRQSLAESAIVCGLGTAAGLGLAVIFLKVLKTFPPASIPRLETVGFDRPVAAFTAGVMLLVTVAVGLVPALTASRIRVGLGMAQSMRSTETRSAVRLRDALTTVEIALAVMLLVCGGLAMRSFQRLLRDDVGFHTAQLFTFKTNLTPQAYPDLAGTNRFYDQLTAKLENLPGVVSVAAVSYLPLSGESQFLAADPVAANAAPNPGSQIPVVAWRVVRGPYFRTMESTLLSGRFFDATDHAGSLRVAIVDDEFVRRFWTDERAAMGQVVRFGSGSNAETRTIIGVVRRMKHAGPGKDSMAEVYVPQTQFYQRGMYTVMKTTLPLNTLPPLVRARLAEIDATVPMYFDQTMEQRFASALALPRFLAGLIGGFSSVALVLAGVGVFGVTAYAVAQRSREFGIRFALGATRRHVAGIVFGRVARLAVAGGAVGVTSAYLLARLMSGLLFGVQPADPATLALVGVVTVLMTAVASLPPLLRAIRADPVAALRAE